MTPPRIYHHKRLSPDEVLAARRRATELVAGGLTLERAGQATGTSAASVARWADEEGVDRHRRPRYPAAVVEEVRRRAVEGQTPLEIHRAMPDVGYTTVARWARAARGHYLRTPRRAGLCRVS